MTTQREDEIEKIAKELGVSISSLKRAFRGKRLAYHNYCQANPDLVKKVNKYNQSHNLKETAKHFNLKEKQIEHIIYKYRLRKPKQIRWTNDQIVTLAKMAGLVRMDKQAKIFNRPNAHTGSIKSVWIKRFNNSGGGIHGMSNWMARQIVNDNCPRIKTQFYEARRKGKYYSRNICLWTDMAKHLKQDVPQFISDAVKQMAEFQKWLFKSDNPRDSIIKLLDDYNGSV